MTIDEAAQILNLPKPSSPGVWMREESELQTMLKVSQ